MTSIISPHPNSLAFSVKPHEKNQGVTFDLKLKFDKQIIQVVKASFMQLCTILELRPILFLSILGKSYSCLHTLPPWLEQIRLLHVDLLLSSLSGGERQPRVQPAVSGPLWRGQTEG